MSSNIGVPLSLEVMQDAFLGHLDDILKDNYDKTAQYKSKFMSVHTQITAHDIKVGREESNAAHDGQRSIETVGIWNLDCRSVHNCWGQWRRCAIVDQSTSCVALNGEVYSCSTA